MQPSNRRLFQSVPPEPRGLVSVPALVVVVGATVAVALLAAHPRVLLAVVLAFLLTLVIYLGTIGVLARLVGVRVDGWSLSFGPAIASLRLKRTWFRHRVLPIGGFVRLHGLEPRPSESASTADEERMPDPGSFYAKPRVVRVLLHLIGPASTLAVGLALLGPGRGVLLVEKVGHVAASWAASAVETGKSEEPSRGTDTLQAAATELRLLVDGRRFAALFGGLCVLNGLLNLLPLPGLLGGSALLELLGVGLPTVHHRLPVAAFLPGLAVTAATLSLGAAVLWKAAISP